MWNCQLNVDIVGPLCTIDEKQTTLYFQAIPSVKVQH